MQEICGVDIFISVVLLVSAILSFSRGFTSEMLGIGAWFVAGIAGFYAMPVLEPYALKYLHKPVLANLAVFAATALVTLVTLTLIFSRITDKVQKSVLNRLDHFLGFIFGLVRGVVILVLVYFLMMTLTPKTLEDYQKQSKTFPYLERVTDSVKEHLPESLFDNPTKKDDGKPDNIDQLIEKLNKEPVKKTKKKKAKPAAEKPKDPEKTLFDDLNAPKVEAQKKKDEPAGYDKREREQLDRLFLESLEETDAVVD